MLLRLAFIWMACFCVFVAGAQKLIFKTYTVSDGLVANPVQRIFQDSKGFLWFCTWEGLSKYDGDKFTNYTIVNGLSDNSVNDVYEAADGKLYVALNTGITDLIENDLVVRRAVFKNVVINRFYCSPDHRVFAVTDTSGIWELKNGQLVKIIQQDAHASYSRMISLNDSLFAVCSPEIPIRIFTPAFNILSETKPASSINECIFQDSQKRLWAGTSSGLQLFSVTPGRAKLKQLALPQPFHNQGMAPLLPNDILEEANGNLWIGTSERLVNLKPNGGWEIYSENDGLPSKQISCLLQDREKNIWIGTTLGISKLSRQNNIQIYTAGNGLKNNNVLNLFTDSSTTKIFIGLADHTRSIQQFNSANEEFTTPDHGLPMQKLMSFGLQTFFSNHELGKFNETNLSIIRKLKNIRMSFFCGTVSTDRVFIGTGKGILIGTVDKIRVDTALPWRIHCMLLDRQGYLWLGTWKNGLYRISPDGLNHQPYSPENFTGYLPGKYIRSLCQDRDGNIWIGTRYNGVVQLIKKGNGYQAKVFNQRKGLASNFIRAIDEDHAGNIWLGSFVGLDKLVSTDTGFRVFNFSRINNLFRAVNDVLCKGEDEIWCATTQGLVHIRDKRLENMEPLTVYLSSVFLAGNRYLQSAGDRVPSLQYSQNLANFEFTSAGFINEKQIYYSYRLLGGSDTNWSLPVNLHAVSYASLQPGNYRFEVRTIGWNGNQGKPAQFRFIIRPPFWKTWWFLACLTIIVLSLLYALYRYRINQLLNMQRVRNRLATDLHDDIGSTLTNISILSELGKKNLNQPAQAIQFLQRITEEVSTSGQALDDIIWSVNSRNDSMQETLARMRRYAAELFDSSSIDCHIQLEEAVNGMKFHMEQRRDVYLIYKEALNNIFKHAEAKNIWVKAEVKQHALELSIRDDGKGFILDLPNDRNGLKNLRWRVEKWKGKMVVTSEKGKGTHIVISMPIQG